VDVDPRVRLVEPATFGDGGAAASKQLDGTDTR
jgi:hypothetical protein